MKIKYFLFTIIVSVFCNSHAQDEEWFVLPNVNTSLATRKINILPNGEIFVGTYNEGAKKLVNNNWVNYTTGNSGISDNDVREIAKDSDGNYWFATWSKLSKYTPSTNTWQQINVSGVPLDILYSVETDDEDRIWVGTGGGAGVEDGLYLLNTGAFYNSANSPLGSNWITFLDKDNNGNIWAGGKNLVKIEGTTLTGTSMESIGFPANSTAIAIDFTSSNHIWLAVYNGGVAYFNGVTWTIYTAANSGLPENTLWSLAVDKNDNVWIGTENSGLVRFDGINWTTFNVANSPITNNRIDDINCDSNNNIWIAPSYGGLLVYNQDGIASVNGNVFYDINNDNIRQVNEPPSVNTVVSLSPGNHYAVTDNQGNYKLNLLQEGNFSLATHPQNDYITNIYPTQVPLNVNATFVPINQNFAIHLDSNITDVSVTATAVNVARPGFATEYFITVKNYGTLPAQNISVQLNLDPIVSFQSASEEPTITGNQITWSSLYLGVDETKTYQLTFMVPADVELIGTAIESIATCSVDGDSNTLNNTSLVNQVIVGSYDPNDKTVTPQGVGTSGNIPLETEELDYTIRFQNTGTYEAWRVIITDQISTNLDLRTLNIVAASHDYTVNISEDRKISWIFNNINLPHAAANELESNGFVRFKISPIQQVNYGDVINNVANIYFDYNPPIVTNQTTNTFFDFTMTVDKEDRKIASVYPNPVKDQLTIASESNIFPLTILLFDQLGRFLEKDVLYKSGSIMINDYSKSILFYKLVSPDGTTVGSGKLIIE